MNVGYGSVFAYLVTTNIDIAQINVKQLDTENEESKLKVDIENLKKEKSKESS